MATDQTSTPFAKHAYTPAHVSNDNDVPASGLDVVAGAQSSMPSAKSYQLVKSATGNVYVEVTKPQQYLL